MPKVIRVGRGDGRSDDRIRTPGAPGCLYAPLKLADHVRLARAAFAQRGWTDLAVLIVAAICIIGLVVAVGPEVARP